MDSPWSSPAWTFSSSVLIAQGSTTASSVPGVHGKPVPRILLNHDPRAFVALPTRCADLILSGHTHGGHAGIQLGKDRAVSVVGLLGIPDQGLYRRADMQMFVTRCVGFYGYPMRLGIPPEISILTLRSAQKT